VGAAVKKRENVVVAIWGDNASVPYPVLVRFSVDAGGFDGEFLLTVEQARQLARDTERTCRRVRKLAPLKRARR
jgi:hypothetical protein